MTVKWPSTSSTGTLCFVVALLCIGLTSTTQAREQKRVHFSSGTGFFVSSAGHLITNEHVVRQCKSIQLLGAVQGEATLVAVDTKNDLALLHTRNYPQSIAPLRYSSANLHPGDKVVVMGYPGEHALRQQHAFVTAKVVATTGPQGEAHWLQFTDAAQQGNSGGPLLDQSGNVIGVVTGKTELYQINQKTGEKTIVQRSDVAVTLPILRQFLRQNRVVGRTSNVTSQRRDGYIEHRANDYIVNVRCITGETIVSTAN